MKDLYCSVLKHHDCLGLLELALGDFPVLALPLVNLATGENTTITPTLTVSTLAIHVQRSVGWENTPTLTVSTLAI